MKIDNVGAIVAHNDDLIHSTHEEGDRSAADYSWVELKPEMRYVRMQMESTDCDVMMEVWQPASNHNQTWLRHWRVQYGNNTNCNLIETMFNGAHAQNQVWWHDDNSGWTSTALVSLWLIRDASGAWHGQFDAKTLNVGRHGRIVLPPNAQWLALIGVPVGGTQLVSKSVEWA